MGCRRFKILYLCASVRDLLTGYALRTVGKHLHKYKIEKMDGDLDDLGDFLVFLVNFPKFFAKVRIFFGKNLWGSKKKFYLCIAIEIGA